MKRLAFPLTALVLATACEPMEDRVENAVREELAAQGTVKQVEMTRENDNRLSGFAVVEPRDAPGTEVRYTCSAERQNNSTDYDWRCRPAAQQAADGGAEPAPSGGKDPGAAPAGGGGPGRMAFAGRWTDNGDCSVVTILAEDGSFIAPNGNRGTWDIQGDQLIFTSPAGTNSLQVYLADSNTIVVTNPDGTVGRSTRC